MKTKLTLLIILFFIIKTIFAQFIDEDSKELYPEKYTFEKADEFQKKGEYEKAFQCSDYQLFKPYLI